MPWLRIVIAAALAGAVTAAAILTGDWWSRGIPGFERNLTVTRILLFAALTGLFATLPTVVRRTPPIGRLTFAAWTVYLGLWLFGTWPGIVMSDTADVVKNSRSGVVYEWFSYLHSVLNIAVLDVVPHIWAMSVLQLLLTASLMAYATTLLARHGCHRVALVAMNLVAAAAAPVVVNTLLLSRDTIFSVLAVFVALGVAEAVIVRRSLSRGGFLGLAVLLGFMSAYRGEGIALVLATGLALLLLRPGRRLALQGAAVLVASVVVFQAALPAAFVKLDQSKGYALSLRLNPLGAVLQSNYYSPDHARDEAVLSKVIDVPATKEISNPNDITPYWENKWNPAASDEDFAEFKRVADRLLRDNFVTVLANRLQTFGAASGLAHGGFTGHYITGDNRAVWIQDPAGLEGSPPVDWLYDLQARAIFASGVYKGAQPWGSALHWNLVPWLLLLVAIALAWRRLPFEALAAALILSRVPLVFLAAPAAQYKYYYAVTLGGIILAGALLGRLRREHLERVLPRRRAPRAARA